MCFLEIFYITLFIYFFYYRRFLEKYGTTAKTTMAFGDCADRNCLDLKHLDTKYSVTRIRSFGSSFFFFFFYRTPKCYCILEIWRRSYSHLPEMGLRPQLLAKARWWMNTRNETTFPRSSKRSQRCPSNRPLGSVEKCFFFSPLFFCFFLSFFLFGNVC